ncbi:transcriptional regulator, PadR-like family [Kribbella flavida DSM 17836]|uniref:Transcriptional regulator, PadR-like family n=1 Tax=Kribbella flavida (strain DSM 17836 / JCM 10339 / NBRC 14399) TaxID=479435 RepID=D2PPV5_KRIFD|nr:PadR family transcriptional regulator [Kribbella flavida]ADB32879.1 transcriptional regulator, PadR-like family [Kribbella flavida DSM 17836]
MASSQTDLAVLAVLSITPTTGYAVRKTIHEQLSAFWSESFGQIYPSIARLKESGLIEATAGGRTGSAQYALTDAGRAHLLDLLSSPPVPSRPRSGTLLRLFFGHLLGPSACADLVQASKTRAEHQLTELAATRALVEAERTSDPTTEPHTRYWLLTISAGEHTARATIAWADEALTELAKLPA